MAAEEEKLVSEDIKEDDEGPNLLTLKTKRLLIDDHKDANVSDLDNNFEGNSDLTNTVSSSSASFSNQEVTKIDSCNIPLTEHASLDDANSQVLKDSKSNCEQVNEEFYEAKADLSTDMTVKETASTETAEWPEAGDSATNVIETGLEAASPKVVELISETESYSSTSDGTDAEKEFQGSSLRTTDEPTVNDASQEEIVDRIVDENIRGTHETTADNGSSDTEGEYESADEGEEIQVDDDQLKKFEESLTDEQKEELKNSAHVLKEEGNELFRCGSYKSAIKIYSRALRTCPLKFAKDRSIMYSNRAVCKMKLDDLEAAVKDCSKALDLHPHYMKALMRRAELYEKTEKLDEALADYQKILELDPSQHSARAACMRLPEQIKERNEKLKAEVMDKLKDLGNLILRPFGLSTNNFQLNQDPNSGGYSVNFVQNPGQ